ncbi:MAG: leucine-rich repeat domain-containing protein, partial [Ruminococcus sp.]|nr:leucine-rich repeat domain-containing protein [Ruminococcus sp.]
MRSKKLFSAVTALALAVSMVTMPLTDQRVPLPDTAVTAHAESNVFSGFEYTEMYGSIWITGYQGEKKNVTIPNTIEGKNVTTISRYAFAGNEDITSISLPSNIINIQDGAFLGCTNLTNFSCTGNKSFEFRGGVLYFKRETETQISMSGITLPPIKTTKVAFFCAKDSTSINIPDGVDGIADYAFMNRSKLEHIVLPSGITYIGEKAFYGCSSLKTMSATDSTDNSSEFNIPYGTIYIGDYAFMDCSEIHSLNLPDTLWAIEDACFLNCTGLKSVFVPDSVKYIGNCAFGYTGSETTRMRRGDFTLYSKVEMNEDGETEPNAASDYAADNAITFADPDQYQGSTVDEDGNRSYTNSDGYAVNLYQNVTHDPNKDFDHVYIYSAVVAPTCTTPGAIAGICYCGHTFYQQFDTLGHAYLSTVVA